MAAATWGHTPTWRRAARHGRVLPEGSGTSGSGAAFPPCGPLFFLRLSGLGLYLVPSPCRPPSSARARARTHTHIHTHTRRSAYTQTPPAASVQRAALPALDAPQHLLAVRVPPRPLGGSVASRTRRRPPGSPGLRPGAHPSPPTLHGGSEQNTLTSSAVTPQCGT